MPELEFNIDKQFIVQLKGKAYPVWAGVLDAATEAGLKSLRTTVVQIPSPENGNLAVVMARAEFEDGRIFEDVGDCSPQSTSPHLAVASLRLASTRAKGRVLRDSINCGQTLLEELPDLDAEPLPAPHSRPPAVADAPKRAAAPTETPPQCARCGRPLTSAQASLSETKFGIALCPNHQQMAAGTAAAA